MKVVACGFVFAVLCASVAPRSEARYAAASEETLNLWPDKPPGETGTVAEEKVEKKAIVTITNVSKPTITVTHPPKEKNTGVAVVVCPGGGYNILAYEHEGTQVSEWLNSLGVTAVLLKYRVPRREGTPRGDPPIQALMDAQRAISLTRSKAKEWGVDPAKVGILGFSAGGHLSAWASTAFEKRSYERVDDADGASCRPDFAALIYPGGVVGRGQTELAPEIKVTAETPPMFFAHAGDDNVSPENSIYLYMELRKQKIPAEIHIYNSGGHGFGMRKNGKPTDAWTKRCEEWLRDRKILPTAAAA